MEENISYYRAKQKVEALKAFYVHFILYLLFNLGLFALNLFTSPDTLWFFWPLLGWGLGVLIHALIVFGANIFFGKRWEEKKIRKIMEKENL